MEVSKDVVKAQEKGWETNRTANGTVAVRNSDIDLTERHQKNKMARQHAATGEYGRGRKIRVKNVKDKKLRRNLKALESKYKDAALKAKDAEILHESAPGFLEAENENERTYKVKQKDITKASSVETARKRFDLTLDKLGPYVFDYSRNGRELLLGGRKGHIATMDWRDGKLGCELQLRETIRDVKWLHNNQYFAVAQKKYTYIYDRQGVELHCLRKHMDVTHMEFLPHHFLLATLASNSWLKYQDVSTGNIVSEIRTGLGPPVSLCQNSWNAILHAGHEKGVVTLWSPNSSQPLVKLLAHKGPVRALAVDRGGRYMVSAGQDLKMAVWDIRMFKEVNSYFTRAPASSLAISDSGLTAVTWNTSTTIWKDLFSAEKVKNPYMAWGGEGKKMERAQWCPFEDVLGLGHHQGFSSILVPGAGEANFDAFEVNPYENQKQRQEAEVKALLNKIRPDMIALDPNYIGKLDQRSHKQREEERDLDKRPVDVSDEIKNKARGRNSALKKYMRKQRKKNIIDDRKMRLEAAYTKYLDEKKEKKKEAQDQLGPALSRFAPKGD